MRIWIFLWKIAHYKGIIIITIIIIIIKRLPSKI